MVARHKTKAFVGIGIWFGLLFTFVTLIVIHQMAHHTASPFGPDVILGRILLIAVAMIFWFFWTCYHLAKAKGYPGAVCLVGVLGPLAQLAVIVALLIMRDKYSENSSRRISRPQRQHIASNLERIVINRRNALMGIIFGAGAVAVGALLVLFRWGIFADHQNEWILGVFIFCAGYATVIFGCWSWVKAKNWNDAVILIGLFPLVILLVPYVRLIFLAAPSLLPASMIMMPLILIVVVMVLPDKSGWSGRKRWRMRE